MRLTGGIQYVSKSPGGYDRVFTVAGSCFWASQLMEAAAVIAATYRKPNE
jgi:hypothetical protein